MSRSEQSDESKKDIPNNVQQRRGVRYNQSYGTDDLEKEDDVKLRPITPKNDDDNPQFQKRGKENPYYVGQRELREELEKYFASSDEPENRIISRKLGEMLVKIAYRYATKPCYSNYYFKSEFISDAIYKMVQNIGKINLSLPNCNPFSYLTCICYCAFIASIKKHKKNAESLKKLREQVYEDFCMSEGIVTRKELEDFVTDGSLDKELYQEITGRNSDPEDDTGD